MASVEPLHAPATPAAEKVTAQGHFTMPRRAWFTRFDSALRETAMALVPIARCGEATPTT